MDHTSKICKRGMVFLILLSVASCSEVQRYDSQPPARAPSDDQISISRVEASPRVPSSVSDYLSSRSGESICNSATFGKPKRWSPYAKVFVNEAQRRNLSCGVLNNNINISALKNAESKYSFLSEKAICYFAASEGAWETDGKYGEYVEEAKRRGLRCGVSVETATVISGNIDSTTPMGPKDLAVIIANSDYKKLGRGIPNVKPAYNDGKNIKRYFTEVLGFREGNIIYLEDATHAQLTSVFGNERFHKGKLFNWTTPNISKVYIYYAGHGAPGQDQGTAYLVPSDTDNETVELTSYPLKLLYKNLNKLPATSITVLIEACFSGHSQNGTLFSNTSGITITPIMPVIPEKLTIISAGAADQVASWERDGSQSLFTKYYLKGMYGEADMSPNGDSDGVVSLSELKRYLDGSLSYFARRYYGRTQNVQIVTNGKQL